MTPTLRALHGVLLGGAVGIALLAIAPPVAAQTEAQRLIQQISGQQVSQDQILERLRASGVNREQAKARLAQAGYDPALVDPYYDRLEGRSGALPDADQGFLAALGAVGILQPGMAAAVPPPVVGAGETAEAPPVPTQGIEVFGLDVFRRGTDQFEPVAMGPVDPDYRLGPNDQIVLILTGDVELAYSLDVTREGFIVIPDVGQVSVNGLTMEGLRGRLYDRLGRVYSGVSRSSEASTRFDVSLGRLRTNQVFVIGDVARPGAYQVSSVGTVLTALYRGGGPTANGSFRAITVQRGGRVVATVDLYDYLLRGDAASDVRLEQGDVVFVPPAGAQVTVQGQVRRSAIYEVRAGESLADVVRFAGGFLPEAYVQRVQVDRILPPQERQPGRDRVLLDADVLALETGQSAAFPLEAGDRVTVYGVLDRTRGRVTLSGSVWRPGEYEFAPGMTVRELVARGDGLLPSAYQPVAHVRRLVVETGETRLLRVSLAPEAGGVPTADLPLEDLDEVTVFDVDALRVEESVAILGEVKRPDRYPLDQNTTVEDLILTAGGFTAAADPFVASVARVHRGADRSDTLTIRYQVRISDGLPLALAATAYERLDDRRTFDGSARDFRLRDGDQVIIRRLAGWVDPAFAQLRGEVLHPGPYALETRQERLSSVVARAGGLTPQAYAPGARLQRDATLLAIDLPVALARPGGDADVLLHPGDELVVPTLDPAVLVAGSVIFPVRIVHRKGLGVGDYLDAAGGADRSADLDRVSVQYPNGSRAVAKKFLFFRRFPDVEPGSQIFVPAKAESAGTDWDQFLSRTLGIATSVLTILVLSNQLR
ncbi:MAG TPA: SLBB domain-containing protein [Longimicrobiales bacterium]|nr:SLBB domain-containing protein [Longimicrobiales bacterium]